MSPVISLGAANEVHDTSIAMSCAAGDEAEAQQIIVDSGLGEPGGNTFSVPLSPTGADPATHFGAHAWGAGPIAPTGVIMTSNDGSNPVPLEHFDAFVAGQGLQRIIPPEE